MKFNKLTRLLPIKVCIIVVCFLAAIPQVVAQNDTNTQEALIKGITLFKAERYAEAAPHLEIAVKGMSDNAELRFMYGWSLIASSKQTTDPEEGKKLSAAALVQLQEAKRLGLKEPMLDSLIQLLGGPAAERPGPPRILTEAEKALEQAEVHFTRSEYDQAIVLYEKALKLDPRLYDAALHAGNAYLAKGDFPNAEKLYQNAITIDPNRETAYRYSATPLMKQKKFDEARDRYIEAYITEPFGGMSIRGINQWADATGANLGHPKVSVPKFEMKDGKPTVNMDQTTLTEGSKAWLAYSLSRASWRNEKFAKAYPQEKAYRHSLQEEAESIRATLKSAKDQKLQHPDFVVLQKLDDEGLLESFILLALTDDGIAEDHPAYLKANRPKLRQYVLKYVISK